MSEKNQDNRSILPQVAQTNMGMVPQLNVSIADLGHIQAHERFLSLLPGCRRCQQRRTPGTFPDQWMHLPVIDTRTVAALARIISMSKDNSGSAGNNMRWLTGCRQVNPTHVPALFGVRAKIGMHIIR
jgi:hypothetical protein